MVGNAMAGSETATPRDMAGSEMAMEMALGGHAARCSGQVPRRCARQQAQPLHALGLCMDGVPDEAHLQRGELKG